MISALQECGYTSEDFLFDETLSGEQRELETNPVRGSALKTEAKDEAREEDIARLHADAKRREAELARIEEEQLAEEKAKEALLMAPDREKLRAFADSLKELPLPVLTTRQGRALLKRLSAGVTEMVAWVVKVSEELS